MDRTAIWPLIDPVFYALGEAVDREIAPAFIAEGFQGIQWWIAYQAWIFIDEPFTAQTLQYRMPFASPALLDDAILDLLADRLFIHQDEGVYRLSDRGQQMVASLLGVIDTAIACLEPLPEEDLEALAGLLHAAVMVCLDAPPLSGKLVARTTYERQWPGEDANPLVRVRHALETLRAYHDEIEAAVWRGRVKSAPEWDVLVTIAEAQGMTVSAVQTQLSLRRAFPEKVYGDAVRSLAKKGWLAVNGDGRTFVLTREGRRLHRDAGAQVDGRFAEPLLALSDEDAARLAKLLRALRQALKP